jgi:hypothetical protein
MTFPIPELRRQFGSIATLYPYAKGPVLTFTAFGSCLSVGVEVPCSAALGRVFDEGWKSWSEGRDGEMMGILRMLSWLGISYRIRQYILRLDCSNLLTRADSPGIVLLCLLCDRSRREGDQEIYQALWRIQSLG